MSFPNATSSTSLPHYPYSPHKPYKAPSDADVVNAKVAQAVIIFFWMAGAVAISSGLIYSLTPLWATGIVLVTMALTLSILYYCRSTEKSTPHIPTPSKPPLPTIPVAESPPPKILEPLLPKPPAPESPPPNLPEPLPATPISESPPPKLPEPPLPTTPVSENHSSTPSEPPPTSCPSKRISLRSTTPSFQATPPKKLSFENAEPLPKEIPKQIATKRPEPTNQTPLSKNPTLKTVQQSSIPPPSRKLPPKSTGRPSTPTLSKEPIAFKENPCSISDLMNMEEEDIAITYGKELLGFYNLPILYKKELEQLKPGEPKIIKSLIAYWDFFPNNAQNKIEFILTRISQDYKNFKEEELQKKLDEFIRLLAEIPFDFSELFVKLDGWALPDDLVVRQHFPLCYLTKALKNPREAQRNLRLKALFVPDLAPFYLASLFKSLSKDQTIKLEKYFSGTHHGLEEYAHSQCLILFATP